MDLKIVKHGILYDAEKRKRIDNTVSCLYEYCDIQKSITLADIFVLLRKEMPIYRIIIGNWVEEIVNEGVTGRVKDDKDIEFLELYWNPETSIYKGQRTIEGLNFPELHGLGYKLKEDHEDGYKKGDRIPYAVEFTPVNELMNCKIKLNKDLKFSHWNHDVKDRDSKYYTDKEGWEVQYTLGHILYGIIWELSFLGSPKDRDKKKKELEKTVDDIKTGKEKAIPIEDINNLKDL
jgi:hypothetical protein